MLHRASHCDPSRQRKPGSAQGENEQLDVRQFHVRVKGNSFVLTSSGGVQPESELRNAKKFVVFLPGAAGRGSHFSKQQRWWLPNARDTQDASPTHHSAGPSLGTTLHAHLADDEGSHRRLRHVARIRGPYQQW